MIAAEEEGEDVRPVRVHWPDLDGLLSGGRCRGMGDEQIDLFTSAVGYVWAKAARAGQSALARKEEPPPVLEKALFGTMVAAFGSGWSPAHLEYLQACLSLVWVSAVWRVCREAGAPIGPGLGGAATAAQIATRMAGLPPVQALSLTQPWGWIILHGGKRLENRTWRKTYPERPIFLHASAGMKRKDYEAARAFAAEAAPALVLPPIGELQRGGIIGQARIAGCVWNDAQKGPPDPWAMRGQYGYRLVDVRPLPFVSCSGMLGFWTVPAEVRKAALGGDS